MDINDVKDFAAKHLGRPYVGKEVPSRDSYYLLIPKEDGLELKEVYVMDDNKYVHGIAGLVLKAPSMVFSVEPNQVFVKRNDYE